jgi:hypothetical protein
MYQHNIDRPDQLKAAMKLTAPFKAPAGQARVALDREVVVEERVSDSVLERALRKTSRGDATQSEPR